MSWFQRHIGPPPPPRPSWLGNTWRALIAAAHVRLWAQILGFGTMTALGFYILHRIFGAIEGGHLPLALAMVFAKGVIVIAVGWQIIALVQAVAITETKLGLSASKDGLKVDAQHDEDQPKQELTLSATATLTPKDPAPPQA